jgi:hypothetical protein
LGVNDWIWRRRLNTRAGCHGSWPYQAAK